MELYMRVIIFSQEILYINLELEKKRKREMKIVSVNNNPKHIYNKIKF